MQVGFLSRNPTTTTQFVSPVPSEQDQVGGKDRDCLFLAKKQTQTQIPTPSYSWYQVKFYSRRQLGRARTCMLFMRSLCLRPYLIILPTVLVCVQEVFSFLLSCLQHLFLSLPSSKGSGSSPVRKLRDRTCLIFPPLLPP